MRALVSYDDISIPQSGEALGPDPSFGKPPPSKKRRRYNQKASQHWDDPDEIMNYDQDRCIDESADVALDGEADEEYEESRELTYDEIWDDSALVNAWNAATEEYEAYHGGEKHWKKESINKSALWYNIPPSSSRVKPKVQTSVDSAPKSNTHVDDTSADADGDSHPLNFDTFVPTHDPSLDLPVPSHPPSTGAQHSTQYLPHPPGSPVSQDEAFTRALGAMYWGGYWTAVYHCQANRVTERPVEDESNEHDSTEIQNGGNID